MKLVFVSSYHYPAYPAQFKHGLIMAQNYARVLSNNFLYLILFNNGEKNLNGINFLEINKRRLPLRKLQLISAFYFFWLGIFFLLNKNWRGKETAIITQESKIAFLLLIWKKIFHFSVIYECHGLHSALTDEYVCRNSDYLVFVTKKSQKEAEERFGNIAKSALLPNAVDLEIFNEVQKFNAKQLRQDLGLPADKILVGYIGRFTALGFDKGIGLCLAALKEISDEKIIMCFVGGTNEEIERYKKIADNLGVEEKVIFVGYQKESLKIAQYTSAMDILIYIPPPEKFFMEETSPMKLYEYMAAKKPIIVSDFPSMREILDEDSAVFVNPPDIKQIAREILNLASNRNLSDKLAQNAYEKVLQNTWQKRAQTIIELTNNLVKK